METQGNLVKFFPYVVNEHIEMLRALFGRDNLLFEEGVLPGYELCIQTVANLSNQVTPGSPLKKSPREIMMDFFGEGYELYVIRANPEKEVKGKIWYVSEEEYEYLREWEMVEYGMSEDITAKARTDQGDIVTVRTYGLVQNPDNVSKTVEADYRRVEATSTKKLERIKRVRKEYVKRTKSLYGETKTN